MAGWTLGPDLRSGEIECDDPVKLARYLNMTVVGMNVMARSGMSKQALRQLVDVSLQVVRGRPADES